MVRARRLVRWSMVSVLWVCVAGCGPTPVDDPLAIQLDRDRDPARRLAAAKQIDSLSSLPDPGRAVKVLHRVLWSDSQPTDLRLWSMDRLIEYDPAAFWRIAQRRIREVDLWPVLGPLIDRAVEHGDPEFTVALVRSFARDSKTYTDEQRPEHVAIEALNLGQSAKSAVWEVFASEDDSVTSSARVDAWALTHRLVGAAQARQMLMNADSQHPMIVDMKSAIWLDLLPANREGVLWLMHVRSESGGAYWERAEALASKLDDLQREGLELRHLPVLLYAEASALQADSSSGMARLTRRLSGGSVAARQEPGIAMTLPSEHLSDHASALCFMDVLTMNRILDALSDRALVSVLFNQGDRDLADTTTEYGGVLVAQDERIQAQLYPPDLRVHDQKFYSSNDLIRRMYTGLAHYHFHAQKHTNQDYAGPGLGDLTFVQNLRANAVVFTFLDRDTLGVDYYQPGGVVVDLGVIRR